jgi:hypothetical protein
MKKNELLCHIVEYRDKKTGHYFCIEVVHAGRADQYGHHALAEAKSYDNDPIENKKFQPSLLISSVAKDPLGIEYIRYCHSEKIAEEVCNKIMHKKELGANIQDCKVYKKSETTRDYILEYFVIHGAASCSIFAL